ncbi:MAG: lysylphosphatidylglycerol synthase transmembrane domain-containing protein [Anaerolineae bacterium]|nr:lysylphosphatidylglycerol synthase transmembrane domain-containing protein [Anaerolineae bacterium]
MRDKLLTGLKVVISVGLIAYLFRRVDLAEVGGALASARPGYLLLALLLYLAAITLNAVRWQGLLRAQGIPVPLAALLEYTFVGVFFNNFLPANVGGDIMRGYGLARYTDYAADAAVSVIVDRIVGLLAFLASAVVAALVAMRSTGQANLRQLALVALVALGVVGLGFLLLLSRRLRAWLERFFRWRPLSPLAPLYSRLSDAFDAYRHSHGALALAFLISLALVFSTNFVNWFLAQALGGGISFLYICLFNPLIAFVLLVPISIGGLGLNQSAYVFFFGLVGVPERLALAVSLLLQIVVYLSSLPGGVLWWRRRDVRGAFRDT